MQPNRTPWIPAAAALAFVATTASAGAVSSTPVASGEKVTGTIEAGGDLDAFRMEIPEGGRVSVDVRAAKKSSLLPNIVVFRPDGSTIPIDPFVEGLLTPRVRVTTPVVPVTGDYTVSLNGLSGTSGGYTAIVSLVLVKTFEGTLPVPAGGTATLDFTAVEGASVQYTVKDAGGAPAAGAFLRDPSGFEVAGGAGVRKGSKISAKLKALEGEPGRYAVVVEGASGAASSVEVKVVVKAPRTKKLKRVLGAEPRPAGLTPVQGKDGDPFTITGTGFEPGARVVFEGAYDASSVEVVSPTELHGLAAVCPAADVGGLVSVLVVNPDGQYGALSTQYRFVGRPQPAFATPAFSPTEGGTTVSVTGSGFRAGFSVEVGGVPATGVVVHSSGSLSFVSPPHEPGTVAVVVFDEFDRPGDPVEGFTYADAPTVTGVSPPSIPSHGGHLVTLTGTQFVNGDLVFVDGEPATGVTAVSGTTLTFVSPPGAAGEAVIEVRDPIGRSDSGTTIVLTRSLQEVTAGVLPAAPSPEEDFLGATVSAGDLDGDGRPELLLASPVPHAVGLASFGSRLLANDGTGAFTDATTTDHASFSGNGDKGQADAVVLGDLDDDGNLDAVFSRAGALAFASEDITYDGYPAKYLAEDSSGFDLPLQSATRFLRGSATGKFTDATASRVAPSGSTPAGGRGEFWQAAANAVGDMDGDGDLDLVIAASGPVRRGEVAGVEWTYTQYCYSYYYGYYYTCVDIKSSGVVQQSSVPGPALRVLLNDGSGVLEGYLDGAPTPVSGNNAVLDDFRGVATALGDFDGNGSLDVAVVDTKPARKPGATTSAETAALRILFNDGNGALDFDATAVPVAPGEASAGTKEWWHGNALAAGDLDGDGDLDLLVGRDAFNYGTAAGSSAKTFLPALVAMRNDGAGGFTEATSSFLPGTLAANPGADTILGASALVLADIDGDGNLDIVLTGPTAGVAPGTGGMGPNGMLPSGTRPATRVLLGDGGGVFTDATAQWVPTSATDAVTGDGIAVADLDGDGHLDVVVVKDAPAAEGLRSLRIFGNR